MKHFTVKTALGRMFVLSYYLSALRIAPWKASACSRWRMWTIMLTGCGLMMGSVMAQSPVGSWAGTLWAEGNARHEWTGALYLYGTSGNYNVQPSSVQTQQVDSTYKQTRLLVLTQITGGVSLHLQVTGGSSTYNTIYIYAQPATPVMVVTPSSLNFELAEGATQTESNALGVINANNFSNPSGITYRLVGASDDGWLSFTTGYYNATGANYTYHDISIDATGLEAGTYNGTVTVEPSTTGVASQIVPVTLNVMPYTEEEEDCPSCLSCAVGTAGTSNADVTSLFYETQVGTGDYGQESFALYMDEEAAPVVAQPSVLQLRDSTNGKWAGVIDVIEVGGDYRQILTDEVLVDIVTVTTNSFELRYYHRLATETQSGGLYVIGGGRTPYSKTLIENPLVSLVADTDQVIITEYTDNAGLPATPNEFNYFAFEYTSGSLKWDLDRGTLASGSPTTPAIIDTVSVSCEWIESNTKRKDTREVRNSAGTLEEKIVTIYQDVVDDNIIDEDEKERPIERIIDPGGKDLTETWEYTAYIEGGETVYKLTYEEDAWGRWTEYTYVQNTELDEYLVSKEVSGFESSVRTDADSLNRVVEYLHEPFKGSTTYNNTNYSYHRTTTTTKLLGETVSIETVDRYSDDFPQFNYIRSVETIEGDYEVEKVQYAEVTGAGRRMVRRWVGESLYETVTYTINVNGELETTQKRGSITGDQYTGTVTAGEETFTVEDEAGNLLSRAVKDIVSGQTLADMVVTTMDDFGRPTRIDYPLDSTYEIQAFGCCGLDSATGRDGATTTYDRGYVSWNSVNRRFEEQTRSVTDGQGGTSDITTRSYFDTQGRLIAQTSTYDSLTTITTYEVTYNLAGEMTQTEDALNQQTTYSRVYQSSPKRVVETTTYPTSPATTRVETYFPDGSLEKLGGTAVNGYVMDYGISVASGGFVYTTDKTTYQNAGVDTSEWEQSFYDGLGRLGKTRVSDEDASGYAESRFHYYGNTNLLEKTVDPDGVTTVYDYDQRQRPALTAVLYNPAAPTANLDQEVKTDYDVVQKTVNGGQVWVRRTTQTVAPDVTADQIISISETALDGSQFWSTQQGVETATTITRDRANAKETVTTTFADGSYQVVVSRYGLPVSEDYYRADAVKLTGTDYRYDERGRLDESTDARNGSTSFVYDDLDRLTELTTPDPDTTSSAAGDEPQTTKYFYVTGRDQIERIELPDGTISTPKEQHFTYHPTGELEKNYGARTYPVEYAYDYRGRLKSMTTWQSFNESTGVGISGSAETQWQYFAKSGSLQKKIYPAPSGAGSTTEVVYAYTPGRRLDTKTNARSQVTDYAYDTLGRLDTVDYLDDATIDLDFAYNAAGQIDQVDDAVLGVLDYTYTSGRLTDEDYTTVATPLHGVNIDRTFDSLGRLGNVGYTFGSATGTTGYGYETGSSRLATVSANGITHTYNYESLSGLVSSVASSNKLTVTKVWDKLNRLKSITSNVSSITAGSDSRSYVYAYNAANQRTTATMAHEAAALNNPGGAYWDYSYDDLGQVTGGVKKLVGSGTAVNGYNYGYTFDEIGNRTQTSTNGQTENWTPNLLNEYDDYDVSRYLDIFGKADASASVTVNSAATTRQNEYFYKQLDYTGEPTPNDAQWQSVTIDATLTGGGHNNADRKSSASGHSYLAPNPTVPTYDADGNLLTDGRWSYTWDSENRLVAMETLAVAVTAGAPKQKLEFVYDYIGRRVQKKVYSWNGSLFVVDSTTLFIYDGWNLLYETTTAGSTTTDKNYIWGLDLSGTLQGAGGVGGLLAINIDGASYFPTYDGNGNVTALVNDITGAVTAEYEYGPFGEALRSSGAMAKANPFRFSTKYTDETGLVYYGYRYYDAAAGRWLNRDPLGESGGVNLYGFVGNDGVNVVDFLGLDRLLLQGVFFCRDGELILLRSGIAFENEKFFGANQIIVLPGRFEFGRDRIFFRIGDAVITATELLSLADDEEDIFRSSGSFRATVTKLGTRETFSEDNPIFGALMRHVSKLDRDPYMRAKARESGDGLLSTASDTYTLGILSGAFQALVALQAAITAIDAASTLGSFLKGTPNESLELKCPCSGSGDVKKFLLEQGYENVRVNSDGSVYGEKEIFNF